MANYVSTPISFTSSIYWRNLAGQITTISRKIALRLRMLEETFINNHTSIFTRSMFFWKLFDNCSCCYNICGCQIGTIVVDCGNEITSIVSMIIGIVDNPLLRAQTLLLQLTIQIVYISNRFGSFGFSTSETMITIIIPIIPSNDPHIIHWTNVIVHNLLFMVAILNSRDRTLKWLQP